MSVLRPDLLVIGLDPAGIACALGAAAAKLKVLLVTQGSAPTVGVGGLDPLARLVALGGRVIEDSARFRDANHLMAAGHVLSPRRIALALPARAATPTLSGLERAPRWTPGQAATAVLVLGGGPQAAALAQSARAAGHRVLILAPAGLLPGFDSEATGALADRLRRDGVSVIEHLDLSCARVEPCPDGALLHLPGHAPLGFSHWCSPVRAAPDFSALDLEAAGIALTQGRIACPRGLFSTNARALALGASRSMLADAALAEAEAGIALASVMRGAESARALSRLPRLAHGPLSLIEAGEEEAALARHARASLRHLRTPLAGGGVLKAVTDRRGRVLRFVVLAREPAGLAAPLAQALAQGLRLSTLASLPLPALEETTALRALGRQALAQGWFASAMARLFGLWR